MQMFKRIKLKKKITNKVDAFAQLWNALQDILLSGKAKAVLSCILKIGKHIILVYA